MKYQNPVSLPQKPFQIYLSPLQSPRFRYSPFIITFLKLQYLGNISVTVEASLVLGGIWPYSGPRLYVKEGFNSVRELHKFKNKKNEVWLLGSTELILKWTWANFMFTVNIVGWLFAKKFRIVVSCRYYNPCHKYLAKQ